MQDNRITKGLVDLFREAASLEPVGPYVAEACAIPILNKAEPGSIAVELGHLGAVTNAMSESVTDKQLSESKRVLETTTTFKIHKALTLFPVGQRLLEVAAAAISARSSDSV